MLKKYLLGLVVLIGLCATASAAEVRAKSPDGKVLIAVTDAGGLSYTVWLEGREVVSESRFGIIADDVDLGANVTLGKSASRRIHNSYALFGGHRQAVND